ncbi:hypothetical protein BG61_34330 [Caballeronia glathei]|jgi:hypothetical protein|uniref:Uncharacterized protein n=1 Tax=Caballeronia glathei TaxID=60547 RepID=A0A069PEW5_9BURK|nr:hypothetical protein BG61_34330 [Caballeronia glathei]
MAAVDLIQALAATAELCGTNLSEAAAKMLLTDLADYDERAVLVALSKCRRELKGRLTLAEIISRIDDGRPGAEEAWAVLPFDEGTSVVWTEEMSKAFWVAYPLIEEGEKVAARMAFKESYLRLVAEAREHRIPAHWTASLGHDKDGRQPVLAAAVEKGRISKSHACALIPNFESVDSVTPLLESAKSKEAFALAEQVIKRIGGGK